MSRAPLLPVLVLCAIGAIAAATLPFAHVAPNRLLSGIAQRPHPWLLAALWGALAVTAWPRAPRGLAIGCVALVIVALPWCLAHEATIWLAGARATTRVQAGAGFWTMWLAAGLLLLDRLRGVGRGWQVVVWVAVTGAVVGYAVAGGFDGIAVVREFHAQHDAFVEALFTHLRLCVLTLSLALLIGAPLGLRTWRTRRGDGVLLGVLAFLQTVPSLALFALLIGPFAWIATRWPVLGAWGFGGTGAAPAVFALVLYALLPVVRYTIGGLEAVPADARDAARGLGMSRWQVLVRVQLPLGWPVLLAGLRIVAVQTIGLAAVAALIGAGGLGRFVFLGIGQGATDMVLLGTLAIIGLALLVDLLFQGVLALTERRA
ncbi:ABC transporter permease [Luteibacter sp. PPL201]|uniref:ABC transporter permease n=1 Tax=Luteibacter sahnii TaxID=3021977 RepID=A0ABT6B671_9GAMM